MSASILCDDHCYSQRRLICQYEVQKCSSRFPERKVTSWDFFLCPANSPKTQRLCMFYHKWQSEAVNPLLKQMFDIFAWKDELIIKIAGSRLIAVAPKAKSMFSLCLCVRVLFISAGFLNYFKCITDYFLISSLVASAVRADFHVFISSLMLPCIAVVQTDGLYICEMRLIQITEDPEIHAERVSFDVCFQSCYQTFHVWY